MTLFFLTFLKLLLLEIVSPQGAILWVVHPQPTYVVWFPWFYCRLRAASLAGTQTPSGTGQLPLRPSHQHVFKNVPQRKGKWTARRRQDTCEIQVTLMRASLVRRRPLSRWRQRPGNPHESGAPMSALPRRPCALSPGSQLLCFPGTSVLV